MEPVIFCSQLVEDKSPFGAIPCKQEVAFRVRVGAFCACKRVEVVFESTPFCAEQTLTLHRAGLAGGYDLFCGKTRFETAGVRFYYLRLVCQGNAPGEERVRIAKKGPSGCAVLDEYLPLWQLTVYEKEFTTPAWSKGAVAYQIFPDRFYACKTPDNTQYPERYVQTDPAATPFWGDEDSDTPITMDYFGGDLAGITQKLDYLKSLGVDLLYLNPIFEAHSNHRYNTADYHKIDPFLGDEQDFITLCQKAKQAGIRILLDGVFSHTGADSVYFNQQGRYPSLGAAQSQKSPYHSWFCFLNEHDLTQYKSWWGFQTLPETNEEDPAYMQFITGQANGVLPHWQRLGASGWRLDVADELPDDFIERIRQSVKGQNPNALLIGEVWEDASNKESYGVRRTYLLGKGLDSVMNYPFRTAILQAFATGDATPLCQSVLDLLENYPKPAIDCLLNSLSTHDVERAITALAGAPVGEHGRQWQAEQRLTKQEYAVGLQKLKAAYLLLFMLPGIPCVYYGDELGMQGYKDPFNRAYMAWHALNKELLGFMQRLGAFRKGAAALQQGVFVPYCTQSGVMAFFREQPGASRVFCAVNLTGQARTLELDKTAFEKTLTNAAWKDNVCTLPAYGYLAAMQAGEANA